MSRIVTTTLNTSGLTAEQTENILGRRQSVLYVWSPPVAKDGAKDTETLSYWVAADKDNLLTLRTAMEKLCEVVVPDSGNTTGRIRSSISDAVSTGAGQSVDTNQSLATALSLPFWERTDYLSLSLEIIAQQIQQNDKAIVRAMRQSFCRSYYLLNQIERGFKIDPAKLSFDPEGRVSEPPRNALMPYEWMVKSDRGAGIYYIPVEYLP